MANLEEHMSKKQKTPASTAPQLLILARPPKPIREMTEEELLSFARGVVVTSKARRAEKSDD